MRAILFTYFQSGTTSKLQQMKSNINSYDYEITVEMLDQITDLRVTDGKIEDILNAEKAAVLLETHCTISAWTGQTRRSNTSKTIFIRMIDLTATSPCLFLWRIGGDGVVTATGSQTSSSWKAGAMAVKAPCR